MNNIILQGVEGSYSHQFVIKNFNKYNLQFVDNFKKVAEGVASNLYDYGILPLENSTAGSVDDTYKLLNEYDLHICGLDAIKVNHCLLGVKGTSLEGIKAVSSHPQALMQCENFLKSLNVKTENELNTAIASFNLSKTKDITKGVIASELCAKLYNLEILKENCQDAELNSTRFVIISKNLTLDKLNYNRVSVLCRIQDKRNSLSKLLSLFSFHKINLTKIESKNIANTNFEVNFYIDFEWNKSNEKLLKFIDKLKRKTKFFKFLGVYYSA